MVTVKDLALDKIRTDGGTQMRERLSDEAIEHYAERIKEGDEFPPVIVFKDDAGNYWLADGFHRVGGAQAAKRKSVLAEIRVGSVRDAKQYAFTANHGHGVRFTNADKRKSVREAFADSEWKTWSDGRLADLLGVTRQFVASYRPKGAAMNPPYSRVGKDDKEYPVKEPTAGKSGSREPAADPPRAAEPDPLADLQAEYDEILSALTAVKKKFNALAGDSANNAHLLVIQQRVDAAYKALRDPITQARPHARCAKCKSGCKACHGQGWLSAFEWQQLPEESRGAVA